MTKKQLVIGPDLRLPAIEAQTQTEVVYGGKGMGKTNFATVYVEELYDNGLRFCWLDPVGVAYGLKHASDGRGAGLEVLILGGRHGDLAIVPTAGGVVADLVVDEDASVVVDISSERHGRMWSVGERVRFVRDFCLRLYQRQGEQRRPLKLLVDEAGRFVPQTIPKGAMDMAECVGAIEQLVELGRNVGVGVTLLTQRSARMNKSVSELAEMMVAFRTVGPRSIDAIIDWFGEHVPRDRQKQYVERLRELARGTALVVSPGWLGIEGEYAVRARRTFDSSATPVAGAERRPRGKGARVGNLEHYRARMEETVEQAAANDPVRLRREVEALRRENEKLRTVKGEQVRVEVPVPVLEATQAAELREAAADMATSAAALQSGAEAIRTSLAKLDSQRRPEPTTPQPPAPRAPSATRPAVDVDVDVNLRAGARKIVDVLARHHPTKVSRRQVATLAGLKATGGTFQTYWSTIKKAGLIDETGGLVTLTDAGLALTAVDTRAPMTTAETMAMWRKALRQGAAKMLDVLVDRYPDAISRAELGDLVGLEPTGGTFQTYLSTLRQNGLADVSAEGVAASETLFLGHG